MSRSTQTETLRLMNDSLGSRRVSHYAIHDLNVHVGHLALSVQGVPQVRILHVLRVVVGLERSAERLS